MKPSQTPTIKRWSAWALLGLFGGLLQANDQLPSCRTFRWDTEPVGSLCRAEFPRNQVFKKVDRPGFEIAVQGSGVVFGFFPSSKGSLPFKGAEILCGRLGARLPRANEVFSSQLWVSDLNELPLNLGTCIWTTDVTDPQLDFTAQYEFPVGSMGRVQACRISPYWVTRRVAPYAHTEAQFFCIESR